MSQEAARGGWVAPWPLPGSGAVLVHLTAPCEMESFPGPLLFSAGALRKSPPGARPFVPGLGRWSQGSSDSFSRSLDSGEARFPPLCGCLSACRVLSGYLPWGLAR